MSTYDFPIPQIPMESLRRIAEMSAKLSESLASSGFLDVCKSAQQMVAASTAASREASQRVSQAMQPLLDCLAELTDGIPSTADALQNLADKIDDSVLDETSAAIEEALPYMEPEAREYCVNEALPKLAPEKRAKLSRSDIIGIVGAIATILFGCVSHLDNVRQPQPEQPAPTIVYQINVSECPACASANCVQNADDDIRIIDDGLQAGNGPREEADPVGQDNVADSLDNGVDRHDLLPPL